MRIWKQKSKEISDMKDIKKGDSVYVYSDTQNDFDGIVISVGSKYITIQEGTYGRKWRFDKWTEVNRRIVADNEVDGMLQSAETTSAYRGGGRA